MSRIVNPFSAYITKPKMANPSLYEQYRAAVDTGNYKVANAIAKAVGLPLIPSG